MAQPTQSERLEALSGHLLDGFLHLRERYALLRPMVFDRELAQRRGSGKQRRGYVALRQSLYLSCAQDIAKLVLDRDNRTPSLRVIVDALEDPNSRAGFKARYAAWTSPVVDEDDALVREALERMAIAERQSRTAQFEQHWRDLRTSWQSLSTSPTVKNFVTIRDKVTAHTEILYRADRYAPFDTATLDIVWNDLDEVIRHMQRAIELVGFIVRNAGFAWDHFDTMMDDTGRGFWGG